MYPKLWKPWCRITILVKIAGYHLSMSDEVYEGMGLKIVKMEADC